MKTFVLADMILGGDTIRQVSQGDFQSNQAHRKAMTSGGAVVAQVSGKSSNEVSTFTSGDLAALLALNSGLFIDCGVPLLSSTITVPNKLRQNGAKFQAGSVHPALTGANAHVIPTSVEVSQDSDNATLSGEIHWLSTNGLLPGCTDTAGNALAAQAFNAEFAMGPVYINGSLIPGAQSFRVTPGIELSTPPLGSGAIYPTQVSVKGTVPIIEITGNDSDAFAGTIGLFTQMTSANLYMRRRADGGVYSALSDNVRFTLAAGLTDTNNVSVSDNNDGTLTIALHGKTITTSVAAAIPA